MSVNRYAGCGMHDAVGARRENRVRCINTIVPRPDVTGNPGIRGPIDTIDAIW
jgi:hypothetical protein